MGVPLGEPTTRSWFEGWGAAATNEEGGSEADHFIGGLGFRGHWPESNSGYWYGRLGVAYHRLEFDPVGGFEFDDQEGWGGYAAIGRAFYLGSSRNWSIAPEVRFDMWQNNTTEATLYGGAVGIQLTYFFRPAAKDREDFGIPSRAW
ncbi:MAG: hypothetical protein V3T86_12715 [Planctomycetota bacterium]